MDEKSPNWGGYARSLHATLHSIPLPSSSCFHLGGFRGRLVQGELPTCWSDFFFFPSSPAPPSYTNNANLLYTISSRAGISTPIQHSSLFLHSIQNTPNFRSRFHLAYSSLHLHISTITFILGRRRDPEYVITPGKHLSHRIREVISLVYSSCSTSSSLTNVRASFTDRPSQPQIARVHAPDQHLPQTARAFPIDELLRAGQLDIHVGVNADEPTLVLGLTPFQSDQDGFIDSVSLDMLVEGTHAPEDTSPRGFEVS